jgi:modification methylase
LVSKDIEHRVELGDARNLGWLDDESVHLVCTSPPYSALKAYPARQGQLGNIADYEDFLDQLDRVWAECQRVLVPGGRICSVVGDICLSRRVAGRHHVLPLAADIQVRARRQGLDNLTPIRWLKVANVRLEASRSSRFLGKPNQPNGIVKNDIEQILFLRASPATASQAPNKALAPRSRLTSTPRSSLLSGPTSPERSAAWATQRPIRSRSLDA